MAFYPYLFFSGTCREAFTRYKEIFGGDLVLLSMSDVPDGTPVPTGDLDLIMHAALKIGDGLLMASDDPTGEVGKAQGILVNYAADDKSDAERVFAELSKGGDVTQPLAETFFSPSFGMCVDRFGIPWMVSAAPVDQPGG
jgi:PhnB protein